jgi:hypothetical protein
MVRVMKSPHWRTAFTVLAATANLLAFSGCGEVKRVDSSDGGLASGTSSASEDSTSDDLSNPAADALASSVLEAYRQYTESGYQQAVSTGYAGSSVSVQNASCTQDSDASYTCTLSTTVDEPGMSPGSGVPADVTYPVTVDSTGCWTAMRNDEYSSQTTFDGCVNQ